MLDPRERAARIFDCYARSLRADLAGDGEAGIQALQLAVEAFEEDEAFTAENFASTEQLVTVLERGVAGGSDLAAALLQRMVIVQSRISTLQ